MRRFRPQVSLCLLATLTVPMQSAALSAEEPQAVAPGQWVRVTVAGQKAEGKELTGDKRTTTIDVNGQPIRVARPGTTLEGEVLGLDQQTLTFEGTGDGSRPIVVPLGDITRLDVRHRESKKGIGIVIGLLAGGAIGYGIGAATSGPGCQGGETGFAALCSLDSTAKAGAGILGALGGVFVGALVAPGARWEKGVPLEHVHLSLGPTRGRGLALALSVGF